ncbi:MAG: hypothetical protein Q9159_000894, partial [Coniocarpon cinnabarinum]
MSADINQDQTRSLRFGHLEHPNGQLWQQLNREPAKDPNGQPKEGKQDGLITIRCWYLPEHKDDVERICDALREHASNVEAAFLTLKFEESLKLLKPPSQDNKWTFELR